jgi:4-hydroxy-3-methylbut-2-enyl diphosphate reductase
MKGLNIIKLKEQGFCYGVKRAISIVIDAVNNDNIIKPVYLLGHLVHNNFIDDYFKSIGVIIVDGTNRLEMLDKVPNNSTVVFSAHGVSNKVRQKANDKNLTVIDATCPYVDKTFKLVEEIAKDHDIYFIGKPEHPESVAVKEISNKVFIYDKNNIYNELINPNKLKIAHQTTLSSYDVTETVSKIMEIYPDATLLDMICKVTENRQKQLSEISNYKLDGQSLIIVVGDKKSNNSTKLYELSKRLENYDSIFINSIQELDLYKAKSYDNIILTSGTSTPEALIDEIIETLENKSIDKQFVCSNLNLNDFIN